MRKNPWIYLPKRQFTHIYQQLNIHTFSKNSTYLPAFTTICPIFSTVPIFGAALFSFSFSFKNKKKEKESVEKRRRWDPRVWLAAYFLIHKFIAASTGFCGRKNASTH